MFAKRPSLPYPPEVNLDNLPAAEGNEALDPPELITMLDQQQENLTHQAELVEATITQLAVESICGNTDDSQNVELYDGSLGVSREFVRTFSPPVGQLQWLNNLNDLFTGSGNSPGNVNGARWGSGGLINSSLFITAGHCFDRTGGGWVRPKRNGVTVSEAEIATLMKVNFNFQVNGETNQLRQEVSFPVVRLLEFRSGQLDYAIVELGRDASGQLPGDRFGSLRVASNDLVSDGSILCVIQHPNGRPKMIEAGPLLNNLNGRISYDSIDTLGGSSGSPVMNGVTGEVVGVHTNGGCAAFSGANFGVAIGAVRQFSNVL